MNGWSARAKTYWLAYTDVDGREHTEDYYNELTQTTRYHELRDFGYRVAKWTEVERSK